MKKPFEGWAKPYRARVYHFFSNSHNSVCGHSFFDEERDDLWNVPPLEADFCKDCFLLLALRSPNAILGFEEPRRISEGMSQ